MVSWRFLYSRTLAALLLVLHVLLHVALCVRVGMGRTGTLHEELSDAEHLNLSVISYMRERGNKRRSISKTSRRLLPAGMENTDGEGGPHGGPPEEPSAHQQQPEPQDKGDFNTAPKLELLGRQRSVKFGDSTQPMDDSNSVERINRSGSDSSDTPKQSAVDSASSTVDSGNREPPSSGPAALPCGDITDSSHSAVGSSTAEDGSAQLLRRRTTRLQRIGSRCYEGTTKPNPKPIDAASKAAESAALLKKSSKAHTSETTALPSPPHAPSKDLSGFYMKLLGEDWEEQLQEINAQEVENVFDGESATCKDSVDLEGLNIPKAENYQGKFRQRIRRRDANRNQDLSDQVADDLQVADDEPLISADEIAEIRESAWRPVGEAIPPLNTLGLGYHQAWDVGKKGCLAAKVDVIWTPSLASNRLRFFVMDGTDPESFLTYYSKSDLQAARGLSSEKLGSISAWDLRDGHWTYPKAKVFIRRSDKRNRDCILENFASDFYDAMLVCLWQQQNLLPLLHSACVSFIQARASVLCDGVCAHLAPLREMETQAKIELLKKQRRQERSRNRRSGSVSSTAAAHASGRLSAAVVSYKGGHVLPLQGTAAGGISGEGPKGPRKPRQSIILSLVREIRLIGEREWVVQWVKERLQRQRGKKLSKGPPGALLNGVLPEARVVRSLAEASPSSGTTSPTQEHGERRQTEGRQMARKPPGIPVVPDIVESAILSAQLSPRGREVQSQALFG
ncbi:hypothetical protein cyc_00425 [Cyclospora cayetanensis]|uniref:Uncharacterized protein n=1 Tax=Cyclospora cayetanensis TaxID=88456 RepID=A0A1D3D3F8_9EIME|nr:hypothetical protein cyc_00425 [Cyclospora cayetanensis]